MKKNEFCPNKTPVPFRDKDAEIVLVSHKIFLVKKTTSTLLVTCYLYSVKNNATLQIMLPKASAYVKISHRQTKWMYVFD